MSFVQCAVCLRVSQLLCIAAFSAPAMTVSLQVCAEPSFYATPFERRPTVAAMTAVGRKLFLDRTLSGSQRMSCATCHDPRFAFGPATGDAVARGGPDLRRDGFRSVPSLRYTQNIPSFTEHFHENEGDDGVDQGPAGGRTWDGRASSAHEQALLPLLSPFEMANASIDGVADRLRKASYADELRATFGDHVLDDTSRGVSAALMALEVFQQNPEEFYPYDSKYDAYLRGQVKLASAEKRGLALFNDPLKGNCASCHPSAIRNGVFPQFTDYGFIALGAPRNAQIAANRDPRFHDLGLCGPVRTDLRGRAEYCGLFRTPTLRNVALRRRFFHNGSMRSLQEVLRFYVDRDAHPGRWYRRQTNGRVRSYDDLPQQYHASVYKEAPFVRGVDGRAALSGVEIDAVIAFLKTLTDGYKR